MYAVSDQHTTMMTAYSFHTIYISNKPIGNCVLFMIVYAITLASAVILCWADMLAYTIVVGSSDIIRFEGRKDVKINRGVLW